LALAAHSLQGRLEVLLQIGGNTGGRDALQSALVIVQQGLGPSGDARIQTPLLAQGLYLRQVLLGQVHLQANLGLGIEGQEQLYLLSSQTDRVERAVQRAAGGHTHHTGPADNQQEQDGRGPGQSPCRFGRSEQPG
jgi:hypothetical protein